MHGGSKHLIVLEFRGEMPSCANASGVGGVSLSA